MSRLRVSMLVAVAVVVVLATVSPASAQGVLFVKNNKVGIGAADPTFTLHIKREDGGGAGFRVETAAPAAASDWFFQANPVTKAFLITNQAGGNAGVQIFPANAAATFVVRGSKVGIGTQNPQGKLDVNGPIYQRGSQIHADYVFEPDYQLESIEQHAAFMWENKHLPAVAGAQVDENGAEVVELGARNRGMLEELEKAHIYIEELHNRLARLEAQMAETP